MKNGSLNDVICNHLLMLLKLRELELAVYDSLNDMGTCEFLENILTQAKG